MNSEYWSSAESMHLFVYCCSRQTSNYSHMRHIRLKGPLSRCPPDLRHYLACIINKLFQQDTTDCRFWVVLPKKQRWWELWFVSLSAHSWPSPAIAPCGSRLQNGIMGTDHLWRCGSRIAVATHSGYRQLAAMVKQARLDRHHPTIQRGKRTRVRDWRKQCRPLKPNKWFVASGDSNIYEGRSGEYL